MDHSSALQLGLTLGDAWTPCLNGSLLQVSNSYVIHVMHATPYNHCQDSVIHNNGRETLVAKYSQLMAMWI